MMSVRASRTGTVARTLLRGGLGALLFAAGMLKVSETSEYAEALALFRLLPGSANRILALAMPWWELTAGACLLLGLWTRAALLISTGLFGLFAGAVGLALGRGLNIECGCFGAAFRIPASGLHLGANVALALLSAGLLGIEGTGRSPSSVPASMRTKAEKEKGPAEQLLSGGGDPCRK